ncbi:MAG: type VII secretion protein EssC [Lachnospiraceae bacterium]|nr:type VII secretion protein EssC [Lachnospiraceae bacterium]
MLTCEKERKGLNVYLYFYTKDVCFHEKTCFDIREELWIEISPEKLNSEGPLKIKIKRLETGFCICGDKEINGNYGCLKTEDGKPVFLVIAKGKEQLSPCRRIEMKYDCQITVGSGYANDIFYEYEALTDEKKFTIEKTGKCLKLIGGESKKHNREGEIIYRNGKAITEDTELYAGDTVIWQGLTIVILQDMLVCTSAYGTMRIAQRNTTIGGKRDTLKRKKDRVGLERTLVTDKGLHEEEMELEPPQAEIKPPEHPLILTMGPSATMILPILLMTYIGNKSSGNAGYFQITLWMTIASAILSVFWTSANYFYRKLTAEKEERKRIKSYKEYLQRTENYLDTCMIENRETMMHKYPSCQYFLGEDGKGKVLWNKGYDRNESCFIRVGIGQIVSQISIKVPGGKRELCTDILRKESYKLADKYKYLENVPVGIDLKNTSSIAYIGQRAYESLLQSVLQLIAMYDGDCLKIAFFYNEECRPARDMAQCFKWLPHIWDADQSIRYLAGNGAEADEISQHLIKELGDRRENDIQRKYIIIIGNEQFWGNKNTEKIPNIHIIHIGRKREEILALCSQMIDLDKGQICFPQDGKIKEQLFVPETCTYKEADNYMRKIAAMELYYSNRGKWNGQITFLDLYGCRKVEELNCSFRWRENNTASNIRVPIGKGQEGKTVCLDIHEKNHGPHGLMAGTTGSGKSELLQTYLLSLSVSFSPEDVNFFIIDYKGGGMGEALKGLPHCSGVISNLSGRQIKRALAAIKSENRRRQMCFHEAGVSHIEEYTELYKTGAKKEPIPHLLIVVDEFAELKKEEPEFMKEIISVSQVGRSLGIHLILATQKPAGTVDDKIWSNTRFRLCLRVADKQDSHDMLHRPDAAYLTAAGRGYMQVGNNELFMEFQTGYSKAPYTPVKEMGETALVTNTGARIKLKKGEEKKKRQLECIVRYINETSKSKSYKTAEMLWMPELPQQTVLDGISQGSEGEICLGICDHISERKQLPVYYHPVRDGHLCLCGGPASGKSTFLQTLLWQLCNDNQTDEVQFLLITSDCAGVSCYEDMPHCIGIMKSVEEAECFFYHLQSLFNQRKHLLEGMNYVQFQKKQSKKIPQIYIVIDNYGSFREMTQDCYEGLLEKIANEGLGCGIFLIITALAVGGAQVPVKLFEKIKTTVALAVTESTTYGDILRKYQIGVSPAEDYQGRGLCRYRDEILEFQVPLIEDADDYERIQKIKQKSQMIKTEEQLPEKFPKLPKNPWFELAYKQFKATHKRKSHELTVPIGYHKQSANLEMVSFIKSSFVITGTPGSGRKELLHIMIKGLLCQGVLVYLYDEALKTDLSEIEEVRVVTREELGKEDIFMKEQAVLAVSDLVCFAGKVPFTQHRIPIVAINNTEDELSLMGNGWYEEFTKKQCGICLGAVPGNQRLLNFDDLGYEQMCKKVPKGYGYLKKGVGDSTKQIYLIRGGPE